MVGSIKHHHKHQRQKEEEKIAKVKNLLQGNTLDLGEEEEDEDLETKERDILESHVDSRLLDAAYNRLVRKDNKRFKAACYIQRRWRRNHGKAMQDLSAIPTRLSAARSKYVHAPAYLGESCLWQPLHEWEAGMAHTYPY